MGRENIEIQTTNYSIIKILKNTEKSPEDHQLMWVGKTLQEV